MTKLLTKPAARKAEFNCVARWSESSSDNANTVSARRRFERAHVGLSPGRSVHANACVRLDKCSADRQQASGARHGILSASAVIWIAAFIVTVPEHRQLVGRMGIAATIFVCVHAFRPVFQRDVFINRVGSKLGDASYSLYLSHWFVLSAIGKALGVLHLPVALDLMARCAGRQTCSSHRPVSGTLKIRSIDCCGLAFAGRRSIPRSV